MGGRGKPRFSAQSKLKPLEKKLIAAVEAGEDFQPSAAELEASDAVRGGLIRAILLATPLRHHPENGLLSEPRPVGVTPHGIRILAPPPKKPGKKGSGKQAAPAPAGRGLEITETVDLRGLAGSDGGYLPPLEFTRCCFDDAIDLRGARIQSFALIESRFARLDAHGTRFGGNVSIRECRPRLDPIDPAERTFVGRAIVARRKRGYSLVDSAPLPPAPADAICLCTHCVPPGRKGGGACRFSCVIDFSCAEIAGNVRLLDSYLRAPGIVGRKYQTPKVRDEVAADFTGARVGKSVFVLRSTVVGQISFASAEVANETWIVGGKFVASAERRTFDFQLAKIGGLLAFGADDASEAEAEAHDARAFPLMVIGQISGIGMRAGEIWIAEGFYFGHDRAQRGSHSTINFPKADIERTFKVGTYHEYQDPVRPTGPAWIHGEICLSVANIAKNLEVHGADHRGIADLLDLGHAFYGYFGVKSSEPGYLKLVAHGLKVDRRVYISWGHFRDSGEWCPDPAPPAQKTGAAAAEGHRDAIPAAVDLWKSTVGTGIRIGPESDCAGAIRLNSCVIGREAIVDCRTIVPGPAERAVAARIGAIPVLLDLSESTINGHLRIGRHEPRPKAEAGAGKVCKDEEAISVGGAISLESTNVQGGMLLGHVTFSLEAFKATGRSKGTECDPADPDDPAIALNLRDCVCGSDLEVHALRWKLAKLDCTETCPFLPVKERSNWLPFRLGGGRFANIEQGPHAVIDLRGLQCGLLKDGFGGEWGLINRLQLRLAGIAIRGVEPACHEPPHAGPKDETGGSTKWSAAKVARIAPTTRLRWLSFQSRRQRIVPGLWATPPKTAFEPPGFWGVWSAFWERHHSSRQDDFVPQAYEAFSTAYRQAGENKIAQEILVEKKNFENTLRFRRLGDLWRSPLAHALKGVAILLVALLVWMAWRTGFAPDNNDDTIWVQRGFVAVILVILWWRYFVALFHVTFWAGFRYGLSPSRALFIFALCITLGWVSVHWARNGGLSTITSWKQGGSLDPEVALVLDVDPEPVAPQGEQENRVTSVRDPRAADSRVQGQAIYASPSPCNLDVSSLIYALDVFIPLIDLDQERRCDIRDALPAESHDRYFGWRLAKALYELLGWIITSLVILTITGVLRRDLER